MDDSFNPYSAGPPSSPPPPGQDYGPPAPRDMGMVRQVPVVAILLIVQGGLEILMGLMYAAIGPLMVSMFQLAQKNAPGPPRGGPPPEEVMWLVGGIYLVIGVLCAVAGILKIVAGIRNLRYKGRILGFVALGSNVVTIFTCYCAPTAIGLAIYGLIVYCNSDVARAFELGGQGYSAEEIRSGI